MAGDIPFLSFHFAICKVGVLIHLIFMLGNTAISAPPCPRGLISSCPLPSAGVGRTGTLIALDVLLRQLECEGSVGPFSFVKKMRESRPLMVQTEVRSFRGQHGCGGGCGTFRKHPSFLHPPQAQYVFLHQCILKSLQKPAPALVPKEATHENVASLVYENASAIRAQESEVLTSRC